MMDSIVALALFSILALALLGVASSLLSNGRRYSAQAAERVRINNAHATDFPLFFRE